MYIKSGHRFLSDKGQIVFPGPPTRSAFSFSYYNTPTSTAAPTIVTLPDVPTTDEDDSSYIDMWRSKSTPSNSDMLSDKIQMFYIYITVTITTVLVFGLLALVGYMCYKRKGFHTIDGGDQQEIETTRRQSGRRYGSQTSHYYSKQREAEENPGRTLLR